ncbi:T4SS guanine nucleotide exchange effector RalF [Legionella quateirensis]|uniref:Guanine nucleotide exchange protein n=1 Tax=Legionella quateirensis TaxID=45072 RepID=A0A378KPC0_9GAMM|nr:T4SS guanine nucleotide exchange effector RalF [Legionella quateirensis]KTD52875.1 RalF protein, translocated into host cells by the Dot/Icm system [Legionella quateirensis]STY16395.1 guanine nucleotide exchange protein [Legionella quateirensis]
MHPKITAAQRDIAEAFNIKPKNGINMIKDLLTGEENVQVAEEIAEFFIQQKQNLDLDAVGDYLGGKEAENQAVLNSFTLNFDFEGQDFTTAFRTFLTSFKLPGEAQQIDRIVASFGKAYFNSNPGIFADSDAAYVLAFAVMMLQTSLHSSSVAPKDKMTLESFENMLRGCNTEKDSENKKDYDKVFLKKIYDDIKGKPFEFNFVKTNPGYEFNTSILGTDPTFKKLDSLLQSNTKAQDVFPGISADVMATVDKPNSWLNILTGYQGTITLTDDNAKAAVTVQVYTPGIFSKLLFGDQPKVIIQPVNQDGTDPKASIDLAGKIAAGFQTPVSTIKATYDNDKADLIKAYDTSKSALKTEASKEFASNWKREIVAERDAINEDKGVRMQNK